MSYVYSKLSNLSVGTTAHAYAIVLDFKPARSTRGSDWCTTVTVVDDSCKNASDAVQVVVFGPSENHLPRIGKVGDVIRLHRVKRTNYQGSHTQALGKIRDAGAGFAFLLWDGNEGSPVDPYGKGAARHVTITDADRDHVRDIRRWWSRNMKLFGSFAPSNRSYARKLAEVDGSVQYFDLICQVLAIETDLNAMKLLVWDGTDPRSGPSPLQLSYDHMSPQPTWPSIGARVWVVVHDQVIDHVKSTVKAMKWYKMRNLRILRTPTSLDITLFSMSEAAPLDTQHPDVMAIVASVEDEEAKIKQSTVTATQYKDDAFTLIKDVKGHAAPVIVRHLLGQCVQAVVDGMVCEDNYNIDRVSMSHGSWACDHCGKQFTHPSYIYAFSITVQDSSDAIDVIVAEDDGALFMTGLTPTDLHSSAESVKAVSARVSRLTSVGAVVDLWIRSYTVVKRERDDDGKRYRVFGTMLE